MTQTVDPAIEWLEQQAAEYAAALDNPALRMRMPPAPSYLADPNAQPLRPVDDMPALRERLQAVLDEHTPQGIYVVAYHANGQPACGHDSATDDDYDDHHEESDDGVMLCLDQRTGVACRGHYDDEGDQVPYPCNVVAETRAALGMPAVDLEGAEPRG